MKSVIFDLDGTLLNSLDDLAISTNFALGKCGYPTHTIDEVRKMVGNGVGKLIERAVPKNTTESELNHCLDVFKRHYVKHCHDNTVPYPGVINLLKVLYEKGVSIAVASNKLQPAVTQLCEEFFFPYVKIALGERPGINRKPAPDMLLTAMSQMMSTKSDTIYVGDSEVDIATAKSANIPCISVLWGFRSKDFLVQHGANLFVNEPSEIVSFLN